MDAGDRISVRVMLDLSDERYSSLTADDELWFGISARYGDSQIWLANLATNISEPRSDNYNNSPSYVSYRWIEGIFTTERIDKEIWLILSIFIERY